MKCFNFSSLSSAKKMSEFAQAQFDIVNPILHEDIDEAQRGAIKCSASHT